MSARTKLEARIRGVQRGTVGLTVNPQESINPGKTGLGRHVRVRNGITRNVHSGETFRFTLPTSYLFLAATRSLLLLRLFVGRFEIYTQIE